MYHTVMCGMQRDIKKQPPGMGRQTHRPTMGGGQCPLFTMLIVSKSMWGHIPGVLLLMAMHMLARYLP